MLKLKLIITINNGPSFLDYADDLQEAESVLSKLIKERNLSPFMYEGNGEFVSRNLDHTCYCKMSITYDE